MKFMKLKNIKTGLFCDGSGDFEFNNEGKIFHSMQQINRFMKMQCAINQDIFNSCKDDIEVVEYNLIPTKSLKLDVNKLNNYR